MSTHIAFFPPAASTVASQEDLLFFFLCGVTFLFTTGIALAVIYFAVKYRRNRRPNAPARTKSYMWMEITWSVIPLIISLAFFVWGAILFLHEYKDPPPNSYNVYVMGKQWMWKFEHPDGRREINELHVPLNQPVRLIMISQDVLHSFYVPAFRLKHDVIPGHYTMMWFTANRAGEYHIFCAQYCGAQHTDMVGHVFALDPADFQKWLSGTPSQSTPGSRGNALVQQLGCRNCHRSDSSSIAPRLEGLFGAPVRLQSGRMVTADEDYIRESILSPGAKTVANFQNVMPSYEGRVSEEELMDVIAYLKSIGMNK